jgi:hypothetical protein
MPFIPLIVTIIGASGLGTLLWYYSKSESERARLDAKAEEIAWRMFKKAVDRLTVGEAKTVYDEVKRIS